MLFFYNKRIQQKVMLCFSVQMHCDSYCLYLCRGGGGGGCSILHQHTVLVHIQ